MKIVHFCAGLEYWNGMANNARDVIKEELSQGMNSSLTNRLSAIDSTVDVVHIHGAWLPILWLVVLRAKFVKARLIVRPEGSYDPVRRKFHAWRKHFVAPFEHWMLRSADVVEATCDEEAKWIEEYEPKIRKIVVVDLKKYFKMDVPVVRPKIQRPLVALHVLYLGRQHPLKGIKYLKSAVKLLNAEASQLVPQCRNGGCIELRIISDSQGGDLEDIWNWTDILCLPTLSDNFGRVVAESLMRGIPVITTDGAPAWSDLSLERGLFLRGYRKGADEVRVKLLKDALAYYVD